MIEIFLVYHIVFIVIDFEIINYYRLKASAYLRKLGKKKYFGGHYTRRKWMIEELTLMQKCYLL